MATRTRKKAATKKDATKKVEKKVDPTTLTVIATVDTLKNTCGEVLVTDLDPDSEEGRKAIEATFQRQGRQEKYNPRTGAYDFVYQDADVLVAKIVERRTVAGAGPISLNSSKLKASL